MLSTLHKNDAPSAITRLLDLKVPHFLVLSTLVGVVAQRLVRVNCPHCSAEYVPDVEEAAVLGPELDRRTLRRGAGCLSCRQTGFAGRDGVFQIMPISERIRGLVARQSAGPEIVEAAKKEGMRTLHEAALEKVMAGVTTVSEMIRVTGK